MCVSGYEIIVVGGGIGGSAVALRAVQYRRRVAWIRGDRSTARRSRSHWVVNIDNMIGLHEGIIRKNLLKRLKSPEMADARRVLQEVEHLHIGTRDILENTLERIQEQYADFIEIVDLVAEGAAREDRQFVIRCGSNEYRAPYLVLATGVMDRQPRIKRAKGNEVLDEPQWIYPFANRETVLYCIRCEGHLTAGARAAVIGSSESAAQLALMLCERHGSGCAVLTNGDSPSWKGESAVLLKHYRISVYTERIVDLSGTKGRLHSIALEGGSEVNVEFALVSLGLFRVYNDLARALGAELTDPDQPTEVRHVRIDKRGETSVTGLFAVGDMTRRLDEAVMKQIYTAQEYAVRAVDTIDSRIRNARRAAILERV